MLFAVISICMTGDGVGDEGLRLFIASLITKIYLLCDHKGIGRPSCALRHVDIRLLPSFKSLSLTRPL